jgi:putative tryptophan/tyrosine transport system substrate-binding protein
MRRREFVTLLGGAAAAWPLAARAQQQRKVSLIGYVSPFAGRSFVDEAFEDGLQQLGWVKGRKRWSSNKFSSATSATFLLASTLRSPETKSAIVAKTKAAVKKASHRVYTTKAPSPV